VQFNINYPTLRRYILPLHSTESSASLYQTEGVTSQKTGNSTHSAEAPYIPMTSDGQDDCILLLTIGINQPTSMLRWSSVNHTRPQATSNPGEEVEMKPHTGKLTHPVLTKRHLRKVWTVVLRSTVLWTNESHPFHPAAGPTTFLGCKWKP
jgi:hypothetical protein